LNIEPVSGLEHFRYREGSSDGAVPMTAICANVENRITLDIAKPDAGPCSGFAEPDQPKSAVVLHDFGIDRDFNSMPVSGAIARSRGIRAPLPKHFEHNEPADEDRTGFNQNSPLQSSISG
jgi:hypothetical protein